RLHARAAKRMGIRFGAEARLRLSALLRLARRDQRCVREGASRPRHPMPGAIDALGPGGHGARLASYRALVALARTERHGARLPGRLARPRALAGHHPRGSLQLAFRLGGTSRRLGSVLGGAKLAEEARVDAVLFDLEVERFVVGSQQPCRFALVAGGALQRRADRALFGVGGGRVADLLQRALAERRFAQ